MSCSPQDTQESKYLSPQAANNPSSDIEYGSVSAALYAVLPPKEDIDLVIKAGLDVSVHRLMTTSLAALSRCADGFKAGLADMPNSDTHPTLLARYLLILATCLQSAHPELHTNEIRSLSEPPWQLMRRLTDTAINLVTSKDELLGSVEGLECVMLESLYMANSGNLRRAWLVCRRAMAVAQLFGLHRVDCQQLPCLSPSSQSVDPRFLWFRIVCTDRQLCLMLGLPQGTSDVSMATEDALANDSPSGRFERKQCVIASRILARNESSDYLTNDDNATVLKLDAELQRAANDMPSKWWLVPNLASSLQDQNKHFWEMVRLLEQTLYFNLLNLLHLPYMLRARRPGMGQTSDNDNFNYNTLASINASRELLTRYIMLRSHNRVASSCRSVDFFAMTAAMTLVISHLDGHRKQRQLQYEVGLVGVNMLAHQRNGDRAMMEKVLENMEAVAKLSTDFLSKRSADLLRKLLALEAKAAEGRPEASNAEAGHFLQLDIPYSGTIGINGEGEVVSLDTFQSRQTHGHDRTGAHIPSQTLGQVEIEPSTPQHISSLSSPTVQLPEFAIHQSPDSRYPTAIQDAFTQEFQFTNLISNTDEWILEGTDTVFFDNLMRDIGTENPLNTGSA